MKRLPTWVEQRGGLVFGCTGCGRCCQGKGSFVFVTHEEAAALAKHLGLSSAAFGKRYMRLVMGELALIEHDNGDCIFWSEGQGCAVYPVRPRQCRTFPFWKEVIETQAGWEDTGRRCPGIDHEPPLGRTYGLKEIRRMLEGAAETDVGRACEEEPGA